MERFGSFTVDHEKLHTGVYVSRIDRVGSGSVYTVDVRTCRPYVDPVMSNMVMHSVEHIVATKFEELSKKSDTVKKVYWGPMGCQTGFYALLYVPDTCNSPESDILNMLFAAVSDWDGEVPFNNCKDCGNCTTLAGFPEDVCEVKLWMNILADMIGRCAIKGRFDEYPS